MTARICFGRLITSDSRIIPITTMNTGRLMFIPYAHLRTSIDVTRNASVYNPVPATVWQPPGYPWIRRVTSQIFCNLPEPCLLA